MLNNEINMQSISIDQQAVKSLQDFKNPEEIRFGKTLVPAMLKVRYEAGQWNDAKLIPYGKIQLDPAAIVLHYAQEIFEGLKSYKNDDGEVFLFRPRENAKRFNLSAIKMGMPQIPEDLFVATLETFVKYSHHSFTTGLGDAFYLRPFMFGDEAQLGVRPSETYEYYLIGGPAGNYFTKASVQVRVEQKLHRASANGIGSAKTGGNYAASMAASITTKNQGLDQTLWLDPVHGKHIEELSGMNFFAVIDNVLVTPKIGESILHGITRASLIEIAQFMGMKTEQRDISITELMDQIDSGVCSELFASGTASVLAPISSLHLGERVSTTKNPSGLLSLKLKEFLQNLQTGRSEDPFNWRHKVEL